MNFHCKPQEIHAEFDILVMHVTSTSQLPVYIRGFHSQPNGQKVQTAVFRYPLMNLISVKRRRRLLGRGASYKEYSMYAKIGRGKPWYGPFSIFTNKIEMSMGHSL